MIVTLLILQRKCRYPGELAPEILSVVDEITLEDNPVWRPEEIERQKASAGDDAEAWGVLRVNLDDAAIKRALHPVIETIAGPIEEYP